MPLETWIDPDVKRKVTALPVDDQTKIAEAVWEKYIKAKLPKDLSVGDQTQAKSQFVSNYLGRGSKPLSSTFGAQTANAYSDVPVSRSMAPLLHSTFSPLAKASEYVGEKIGVKPGGAFASVAEATKAPAVQYEKEHPWIGGAASSVPALLTGNVMSEAVGPLTAGLVKVGNAAKFAKWAASAVTHGVGFVPFADKVSDIPKQFAFGATVGPLAEYIPTAVWSKLFGAKGVEAAESVAKSAIKGTKAALDGANDARLRVAFKQLGVDNPNMSMDEITLANKPIIKQAQEIADAAAAEEKRLAANAGAAIKAQAAAEKEAVKAQSRVSKGAREGVQKKWESRFKKDVGKNPTEEQILENVTRLQKMSITDLNKEAESLNPPTKVPKVVKDKPVNPVEKKVESLTVQQQTQAKLATPVESPELAAARPDIVKTTDQANELKQPTEVEKPREPFVVKVSSKSLTVLTDEEARQPNAAKKAIERISSAAREFIANEPDERKQGPVVNKAIKLIEYLKQGGMDERLQKEGVSAFDDIGKPSKGAKIGRPTKAETATKPPEVRAIETAEREAAALQQKRNEIAYAKASGKEISPSQISASGEKRYGPSGKVGGQKIGGAAGRVPAFDEFENIYDRPASLSHGEAFVLESGGSPAEAFSEAAQEEFEKAHEQVVEKVVDRVSTIGKTLPKDLAGAKPRYAYGSKQFTLEFVSDIDRASYITAQPIKSKADNSYLEWVMDNTGFSENQVRTRGRVIRAHIKELARTTEQQFDKEGKPIVGSLKVRSHYSD